MGRDVILCLTIIGRVEPTQERALHDYLGRAPAYRDAMHVSTFAVAEQGNSEIGWLARWGRAQSGELLLKPGHLELRYQEP